MYRTLLLAAAILAGCGKDEGTSGSMGSSATPSGAKRIEGGTEVRHKGVTFDIPRGWKKTESAEGLAFLPEGANPGGRIEELYLVAGHLEVKSLKGDAFEAKVKETVGQVQPGAKLVEGPADRTLGDLEGRYWRFEAKTQDGRTAEIQVWGWMGSCGTALFALGYPEAIAKREADLQAILGSLSKPGKDGGGKDGVLPELAGTWMWISNFNANSGGGRQTDTKLILNADGTYRYSCEHVSTNSFGAAWGSEHDSGTWTATADSITFRSARGSVRTSTLEKRNHPKNTNDPMIILDGKAFVTALRKDPW
jgi:hypothetical protein